MERSLLNNVPTFWLGTIFVFVAVALALLALFIARRSVEPEKLESQHDVAGFLIAVVGVIYAVLLAFVVVIQWEQFVSAEDTASTEAASIGNLYRDAVALGSAGAGLRSATAAYADKLASDEFPYMATHLKEDPHLDMYLNAVWEAVRLDQASQARGNQFVTQAVTDLSTAAEARRTRIEDSAKTLPKPLWAVLILGGVMTIGFSLFFGLRSFAAQATMVSIIAALVGLSLFVILSLDLPFTGDVGVHPEALKDEINEFCAYNFVHPARAMNCTGVTTGA
jgi:hypothetical protein